MFNIENNIKHFKEIFILFSGNVYHLHISLYKMKILFYHDRIKYLMFNQIQIK